MAWWQAVNDTGLAQVVKMIRSEKLAIRLFIFSETNDPQQWSTHLHPHSKSSTQQSRNIIHNSRPIVHLPPDSFPAAAPETTPSSP